ncbi:hypothetical protein BDY21DRAFT_193849 [Lineolata rhizophorae]|uniref:Uncharacterized protein n=1 Tax=Lineolata rhizophorae TaxID=578093 RepID=A0A6A6P6J7_9PEZI|nr:hypothetical protein BDY21DRAFT_193849 [Lineolata rhizophorae]
MSDAQPRRRRGEQPQPTPAAAAGLSSRSRHESVDLQPARLSMSDITTTQPPRRKPLPRLASYISTHLNASASQVDLQAIEQDCEEFERFDRSAIPPRIEPDTCANLLQSRLVMDPSASIPTSDNWAVLEVLEDRRNLQQEVAKLKQERQDEAKRREEFEFALDELQFQTAKEKKTLHDELERCRLALENSSGILTNKPTTPLPSRRHDRLLSLQIPDSEYLRAERDREDTASDILGAPLSSLNPTEINHLRNKKAVDSDRYAETTGASVSEHFRFASRGNSMPDRAVESEDAEDGLTLWTAGRSASETASAGEPNTSLLAKRAGGGASSQIRLVSPTAKNDIGFSNYGGPKIIQAVQSAVGGQGVGTADIVEQPSPSPQDHPQSGQNPGQAVTGTRGHLREAGSASTFPERSSSRPFPWASDDKVTMMPLHTEGTTDENSYKLAKSYLLPGLVNAPKSPKFLPFDENSPESFEAPVADKGHNQGGMPEREDSSSSLLTVIHHGPADSSRGDGRSAGTCSTSPDHGGSSNVALDDTRKGRGEGRSYGSSSGSPILRSDKFRSVLNPPTAHSGGDSGAGPAGSGAGDGRLES